MKFAAIKDIDHLIEYSKEMHNIKEEIQKNYSSLVEQILDLEKYYINSTDKKLGDILGISIELIDGDEVERKHDIDYIGGGHDLVYDYIPPKTIWIDFDLKPNVYKFLILHEFIERHIMEKYKLTYEESHTIASTFEKLFRKQMHKEEI